MKRPNLILHIFLVACAVFLGACSSPAPLSSDASFIQQGTLSSGVQASAAATTAEPLSAKDGYPVTVTDFMGDQVIIDSADRIVSLSSSGTQTLMALDAQDHIVGADLYSTDFLPDVEVVGDYTGPDIEKIISLSPDVVVAADNIQADAIEQLRSVGIPVVAAEPTTWDQLARGFTMLGEIVNNRDGADTLCRELDLAVQSAAENAPAESPTCYYVLSYGNAGNWTSGEGSFINTMIGYAGGTPVTKGTSYPWIEYPIEDLAAADPDIILFASDAGSVEDFSRSPGYENLTAVKTGHVYEIASDLVDLPSPILIEGLAAVSQVIQDASRMPEVESAA